MKNGPLLKEKADLIPKAVQDLFDHLSKLFKAILCEHIILVGK